MSEKNKPNDEERLCPACRSDISIWATKCKFCGSEVGRPRMREDRLTVKDLGGESPSTHRVSKHVMGAIGSFRYDEVYAQDADNNESNTADSPAEEHPPQSTKHPRHTISTTYFIIVAIAVTLVALYLGGVYTTADIREYVGKLTEWMKGYYPG